MTDHIIFDLTEEFDLQRTVQTAQVLPNIVREGDAGVIKGLQFILMNGEKLYYITNPNLGFRFKATCLACQALDPNVEEHDIFFTEMVNEKGIDLFVEFNNGGANLKALRRKHWNDVYQVMQCYKTKKVFAVPNLKKIEDAENAGYV